MRSLQMAKRKRYSGDGYCLFCREAFADADLTDEHIIPEAIHGTLVIKNSSCRPCARRSNIEYENAALNGDLQLPRVLLDLKGKRGSAIPRDVRHLPPVFLGDTTMAEDGERILDFPIELYPKHFELIHFQSPGKLSGIDRGSSLDVISFTLFNIGGRGLNNVTTRTKMINGPFAMMLAKIAYCYAVAEKGFDYFDSREIRDLLNGNRDDVYNFVGNTEEDKEFTNKHLHSLYFRRRSDYLTVLIHLFSSLTNQPVKAFPYEVVVGRFQVNA